MVVVRALQVGGDERAGITVQHRHDRRDRAPVTLGGVERAQYFHTRTLQTLLGKQRFGQAQRFTALVQGKSHILAFGGVQKLKADPVFGGGCSGRSQANEHIAHGRTFGVQLQAGIFGLGIPRPLQFGDRSVVRGKDLKLELAECRMLANVEHVAFNRNGSLRFGGLARAVAAKSSPD